jgi:hypothetical protein
VAEGTSLLRMHTAYTCIVSSNLTVSASIKRKPLSNQRLRGFLRCMPRPIVKRLLSICRWCLQHDGVAVGQAQRQAQQNGVRAAPIFKVLPGSLAISCHQLPSVAAVT